MPKYTVSTSAGTFDIVADRQPTQQEAEAAVSGHTTDAKKATDMAASLSSSNPDWVNSAVGVALDTIPSLVGGAAGFLLTKSRTGATTGSMLGGAAGNWVKQTLELDRGEIKQIESGDIVRNAIYSAALPGLANLEAQASKSIVKTMAIRAGEASGLAAIASVAGSEIKDGKLPTFREFTQEVIPAAVLGGAFGGVQAKYARDGAFIVNDTAANVARATTGLGAAALAYNSAVENGEQSPLSKAFVIGATTVAATHVPSLLSKLSTAEGRKAVFGPEFVVPKELPDIILNAKNEQEAARNHAASLANEVNSIVSKSQDPAALTVDLLNVLHGKTSEMSLPEQLRPYIVEYKSINKASGQSVLAAMRHLPQEMQDEIERNSVGGTYFRTTYAAHDPKAIRGKDFARKEDAKAFREEIIGNLTGGTTKLSPEEAAKKADSIMARMAGDVSYITSGEAGGVFTGEAASSLKRTTDISALGKKFLGEVQDPGAIMQNSLSAQARIISDSKRDAAIARVLKGAGLASDAPQGDMVKLMIPSDAPTFHRDLAGLYTSDVTAEAFKELASPHLLGDGVINKTWMTMSSLSKASKTVLNPFESIVPQIYANMALAASAFRANPMDIIKDLRTNIFASFGRGISKTSANAKIQMFRDIQEAQSLGMLRGGVDVQELKTLVGLASQGGSYQKVMDKFSRTYSFPDGVFRYSIYKSNLKELLSFEPVKGMATEIRMKELKQKAAEITNNQFPTYEKVSRRYRQLSAVGAANVFGAFEFEVMRNSMNQLKYAKQLISDGVSQNNKEMQKAGIKRLMAFTAVAGSTGAIATVASRQLGTTEEQEKAAQVLAPSYDQGKAMVVKFTRDGRVMTAATNYLFPHANMTSAIVAATKGENPLPFVKSSFMGTDLGPLGTASVEALMNTYWGTKVAITEPRDNKALLERVAQQAFVPGVVSGTFSRMLKASKGETNKLGSAPSWDDVALRFAGVRSNTYDVLGLGSVAARNASDEVVSQQTGYRQILKQDAARTGPQGVSGLNEPELYRSRNNGYMLGQEKIAGVYQAMKVAQQTAPKIITDNKIIESLRSAGVPQKLITAAVYKYSVPMARGIEESNTDFIEKIMSSKDAKNIKPMMRARSGGNPMELQRLYQAYGDYIKSRAINTDVNVKLFQSLDSSNGDRAYAIYSALESMGGRKELYHKLMVSGAINGDVMMQLRKMDKEKIAGGGQSRM